MSGATGSVLKRSLEALGDLIDRAVAEVSLNIPSAAAEDAFGEAVLTYYFEHYLIEMDQVMGETERSWADRLMAYWDNWRQTQSLDECQGRCLAVKLSAEVADMSEPMRMAIKSGTSAVIDRLEKALQGGAEDGSLTLVNGARDTAQSLYELWLGASVMAKVHRSLQPMDSATLLTRQLLSIPA